MRERESLKEIVQCFHEGPQKVIQISFVLLKQLFTFLAIGLTAKFIVFFLFSVFQRFAIFLFVK